MIAPSLQEIVDRALAAAFGTPSCDDVKVLTGGMRSALACRVVVRGRAYFLRVGASTLVDPAYELACTRAAADAGIAPSVCYADPADRVLIADFIERAPRPRPFAPLLAAAIARVHALPRWSKAIHHLATLDMFISRLREANLRADAADVLARYSDVSAVYPRDSELVSCHNDLNPRNILFDGQHVWIIDWEAAFVNDRYADLANAASFYVRDAREEADYLAAYFGEPATDYQRARFALARFANHLSYLALLSLMAARAGLTSQPTPDFYAFHDGLLDGSIDLADNAIKLQYANVHLEAARRALPALADAIALVDPAGVRG